jgi:DNA-binding transcriptional LysR family regulator
MANEPDRLIRCLSGMDVQLRHVRSFVAVADELHFGRAAAGLGIAQPAVSRHVRALEEAVGTPLLERTSRATELTDAGRAALGPARELLAAAERLLTAGDAAGEVTVAFTANTIQGWAHRVVGGRIVQVRRTELPAVIRRGDADFAIARFLADAPDLLQTQIGEEPVLAAVADGHRFALRRSIEGSELEGEPLVLLERRIWPDGYDELLGALREQGVTPGALHHTTTPAAALAMVAAGRGVYRLPESAATPRPGVAFVPIEGARVPVVLIRRSEPPRPAVAAAIAELTA